MNKGLWIFLLVVVVYSYILIVAPAARCDRCGRSWGKRKTGRRKEEDSNSYLGANWYLKKMPILWQP